MAEAGISARKFRANKAMSGSPCHACGRELSLGEDVAQCNRCQAVHHAACWDGPGGCAGDDCENRPLAALPEEPPVAPPYAPPYAPPPYAPPQAYAPPQYHHPGAAPLAPTTDAGHPGQRQCPHCTNHIGYYDHICVYCNNVTSADGIYRGPQVTAPAASAALAYGIIGFFICGIIFGPIAMSKAKQAKQIIAADPQYKGEGVAMAGYIMGVVDVIKFVLVVLAYIIGGTISGFEP
jgi:hypothetical protein